MKVSRIEKDLFEIADGKSWWTAAIVAPGVWHILNGSNFQKVSPDGRLGLKIRHAVSGFINPKT